jgi:antitoxin ChpS
MLYRRMIGNAMPNRQDRAQRADLKVSSKRQVTLPAAMLRELGVEPGDRLVARRDDGRIVLSPRPKSWVDYVSGSARGTYGRTKEEIDSYIRELREGWEERARIAEGDAYVPQEDDSESDR